MANPEKVAEICQAYELGYSAGRMNLSVDHNEYRKKSDNYYAWLMGHNTGIQTEMIELDEVLPN